MLIVILLGTSIFAVFGQQPCPEIELILPKGVAEIEAPATVVARLSGGFDYKAAILNWSVSSGKIVEGQGSAAITFVPGEDDSGSNIKITLVVSGLPEHCNSSVSDTLPVVQMPIGEPVDELGKIGPKKADLSLLLGRLDGYMSVVNDSPGYEGFMTITFNRKDTQRHKIQHLNRIYDHFLFRKFDLTRITFAISEEDNPEKTILWTIHPDAKIPKYARSYKMIRAEEYRKDLNRIFPIK